MHGRTQNRRVARNPLLRVSDRVEAAVIAVVALLVLAAIPVSVLAGSSVYREELETVHHEMESRRSTMATATADSTAKVGYPSMATVPVQWYAGTTTRDAVITVDHAMKTSERIELWIDKAGDITVAPRSDADAQMAGAALAVTLWGVIASVGIVLVLFVRAVLNRHRSRSWDRELRQLVT